MISCILLSAGQSSRFGAPKALAKLNDVTVIEHLLKNLVKTTVSEIIVVLGAHEARIKPFLLNHKKVKSVYNKDHKFGQTSSFKVGLKNVSVESQGVMLLPVDYPVIRVDTFQILLSKFLDIQPEILIPSHAGKKGHPPIFSLNLKKQFLSLDNETGINTVAKSYSKGTKFLEIDDSGILRSFNTQEEFIQIKECFNIS